METFFVVYKYSEIKTFILSVEEVGFLLCIEDDVRWKIH